MVKEDKKALPRQVVCAAIRSRETGQIICGPRHHHCIKTAHELGIYEASREAGWDQGFVDQQNEFMTRQENDLYSEDVLRLLEII